MLVYKPGTKVQTKSGYVCFIKEVHIQSTRVVEYTVSWWKDGNRYEQTMRSFEFEHIRDAELIEIGFHTCLDRTHQPGDS